MVRRILSRWAACTRRQLSAARTAPDGSSITLPATLSKAIIGDLLRHPATRKKTLALLAQANLGRLGVGIDGSPSNDMAEAVLNDLPLHAVSVFAAGKDLPTTEEIIRWLSE